MKLLSVSNWIMSNSTPDDPYLQWSNDAETLFEIGKYLNREGHPVQVRLSKDLANRAIEAWSRDDSGELPAEETHEQYHLRSAAATLGLIGLTLESGFREEGDEVIFELDAWFVGAALEAADDAGVLTTQTE
jgi:hypothetical protein